MLESMVHVYSGLSLSLSLSIFWTLLGKISEQSCVLISVVVRYTNVAFGASIKFNVLFIEVSS